MKPLHFTIPVVPDRSLTTQEDVLPQFYPYLHRHKEAQLIWVKQGRGALIVESSIHHFEAGDIFFLAPNQSHVFKADEEGIHTISLFYDPEGSINQILGLPEFRQVNGFFIENRGGFKVPESSKLFISKRITNVHKSVGVDQILHFLHLLRAFYVLSEKPEPLSSFNRDQLSDGEGLRMGKVYNYLMQNYKKQVTLEEVASEANLTPQAFCRYFKKHTGITFVAFLNDLRVSEACRMLTSGRFGNISNIGFDCGFSSVTNFNRVFKGVMGTSPKNYVIKYNGNINLLRD